MKLPVEVRFSSMSPCPSAEDAARRRIRRLDPLYPSVLAWEVLLEQPHPPEPSGSHYAVRIVAHRVGRGMASARALGNDLLVAVRVAFEAVELELQRERSAATAQATRWLAAMRHGEEQQSGSAHW